MCKIIEENQIAKISDFESVAFTECFKISVIEYGKSTKTIESYVGDIKCFIEFLGDKGVEFNGIITTILHSKLQELSSREYL